MNTLPSIIRSWRVMLLRMVDLPEPLGPMRVTISPRAMSMVMSSISGTPS